MDVFGAIIVLIILGVLCGGSSVKRYSRGDLRISRDSSTGEYFVYECSSGREVFRSRSRQDCVDFVRNHI